MREGMLIENINQLYFPTANGCVINFRHSGGEIKPNYVRASGGLGGLGLGAALGVVGSGAGPTSLAGNAIGSSGIGGIGSSGSGGIGASGGGGGGSSSSNGSVLVGSMSSLSGGNSNAFGYSYDGGSSTQGNSMHLVIQFIVYLRVCINIHV